MRNLYIILSFTIAMSALGNQDYSFLVRIDNPQVWTLFLNEAKGKKIEVKAGTSYEWMVQNGQAWQAQYASGKYGTFAWNYDQSLAPDFAKCSEEFKRKFPNNNDLYVCVFEFARDLQRSSSLLGSAYMMVLKKVEPLNINRQKFSTLFSQFISQVRRPNLGKDQNLSSKFKDELKGVVGVNISPLFNKVAKNFSLISSYPLKNAGLQHVLVFGDQGTGKAEAKDVARDMLAVCDLIGCDYGIGAGDNAYPHGPSIKTPNWQKDIVDKFTNIYKPLWDRFAFPFYVTLGNHDIGIEDFFFGDWVYSWQDRYGAEHFENKRIPLMRAQIDFTLDKANPKNNSHKMWNMEDEKYTKLIDKNGIKTFIVSLDTNYFPGQLLPSKTPYNNDQSIWLQNQLQSRDAKNADWRIVFAHHPIYSAGRHGVNIGKLIGKNDYQAMLDLRKELSGIFCQEGVDFYVVGHDHHLELDLIPCANNKNQIAVQILSGAASKSDVAKWHEQTVSEKLFGPDAFSPALIKTIEPFVWANGLTRQDILDNKVVQKMFGFSFLELAKDHAVVSMIQSTANGPKWLACWRFNKDPGTKKLLRGGMSTECKGNWWTFFDDDLSLRLMKELP